MDQHYVAKSYLKAWCDPATPAGHEPYVWVFPAGGGEPKKRAPKKVFVEPEIYTRKIVIPGVLEARDLRIEAGLSTLEDAFVRTRKLFLDQRKPVPAVPTVKLLAFVAAQQARTPSMRDHLKEQWGHVLEVMEDMKQGVERMTPEERRSFARSQIGSRGDGPKMTYQQVRDLVEHPLQHTIVPRIETLTPMLAKLRLAFLCTNSSPGFITSDNPCVWFDSEAHKRPVMRQSPALMYPTIEISMPLTPRCMLYLSHTGPTGYFDLPDEYVAELNRRTRAYADEAFICQTGTADPWWYELGEPSWSDKPNLAACKAEV